MADNRLRINRFGFAEMPDMEAIAARLDLPALAATLQAILDIVFERDENFIDTLPDATQANFLVPLSMSAKLFAAGDVTPLEIVSAACTVRYCAARHMADFPEELAELLRGLPE